MAVKITDTTDAATATGRLFPSGTAALFKPLPGGKMAPLGPEEPVTLVNVSLSEITFRTANPDVKTPKGTAEKAVKVRKFGWTTVPALYARRALEAQEKPGANPQLVVQAADGDCAGRVAFTYNGKAFQSCPYLNCKTHGDAPANVKWSVWQVQHRISMLKTEPAIRAIIERVDPRSMVVMWGLEVIARRLRERQEALGISPARQGEPVL